MKETTDIVVPKLLDYKNIILQWKLFGNHLTVLTAKLFFTSVSTKWLCGKHHKSFLQIGKKNKLTSEIT